MLNSNRESFELFRTTYYRPKLLLWLLLFIVFPSIDNLYSSSNHPSSQNQLENHLNQLRNQNQNQLQNKIQIHPISSKSKILNKNILERHSHSNPSLKISSIPSCIDAYLDHRNNLICPHAPKQLKSVRQRFIQIFQQIKFNLNSIFNTSNIHLISISNQLLQIYSNFFNSSNLSFWFCFPISNPFLHLIIILHFILFIQALSLFIEDALIKDSCSINHSNSFFKKSSSWRKNWSRFKFKLLNHWSKKSFLAPFLIWLSSLIILFIIINHTLGHSDSWNTGLIWHDLPFRHSCHPTKNLNLHHSIQINIIHPNLNFKLLRFLFNRPPFLKPSRSLILIECFIAFISLLQPAQHILPDRIIPKMIKIPNKFLKSSKNMKKSSPSNNLPSLNSIHLNQNPSFHSKKSSSLKLQKHFIIEVETKWLLGVLIEASVCLAAIASYIIVMVHIPYASHYSIAFFLSIYSIKSFTQNLSTLYLSTIRTIECLESIMTEFSSIHQNQKIKSDWTCSICFEENQTTEEDSEEDKKDSIQINHHHHHSHIHQNSFNQSQSEKDQICILNCQHIYHANCLAKWLHYQTFCPICHRSIHPSHDLHHNSSN